MPGPLALVWGNCQAGALARLLTEPLASQGLRVIEVPPVYLVTPEDLRALHALLPQVGLVVSHPVRDEYPTPGCGTADLARRLPADATVLTVASCYDVAAFPWSVNAHDGGGARLDAPLTAYHDLRVLDGADRGLTTGQVLDSWYAGDHAVAEVADRSLAELRRREESVDVAVSPWIRRPGALHAMNHPSNALLAEVAGAVLAAIGVDEAVAQPHRELLGATRVPVDPAPAALLGWQPSPHWVLDGRQVPVAEVVEAHLELYARRPDVVADARVRFADGMRMLRTSTPG